MAEQRPVKVRFHMWVTMDDGSVEELEVTELDLMRLGSGLTVRLIQDLRAEGVAVEASRLDGHKVPGMVLAMRGALVEQPDGALYVQRRTLPDGSLGVVAAFDGSEDRNRGRTT